jgi:sulfonate transport system substrate-binding protein
MNSSSLRSAFQRPASMLLSACLMLGTTAAMAQQTIKIGYQKTSTLLILARRNGDLEKDLNKLGFQVSWSELSNGLLSTLNSGSVDIHADIADAFALYTQAADAPLTYYAKENAAPAAQGIVVPESSGIRNIADLKGKRVAVAKGTGANYFLINALKSANLKVDDIQPKYLEAPDAQAAFAGGNIDAWVIWDPVLANTQRQSKVRVIADGGHGLAPYYRFYMATTSFADQHPEVLKLVFDTLRKTGQWVKANPKPAAEILSPIWGGIDAATVELANSRRSYDILPVRRSELAEQQRIADTFYEAKLIPRRIKAQDIRIWEAPAAAQ